MHYFLDIRMIGSRQVIACTTLAVILAFASTPVLAFETGVFQTPTMTVAYCEPTFKAVRQVPTMAHYFFVNGFSFMGDANRAIRAYGLLAYLCKAEK